MPNREESPGACSRTPQGSGPAPRRAELAPSGPEASDAAPKGRGRGFNAGAAVACVAATLWLATAASAQSPFTQAPSPSGTFTIPTSPSPDSPFLLPPSTRTPTSPFAPARPGGRSIGLPPGYPLGRPSMGGGATPQPFPRPLPGAEGLPELPGLPLPLPLLDEAGPTPEHTGALPPKPEVLPPLDLATTAPVPRSAPLVLRTGLTVTLRIVQVIPADGFSSGERLLNSRPAIQEGDCFLAEIIEPCPPFPILVGGTVTKIAPPGHFGRPGYVSLRMTQLVRSVEGAQGVVPWQMDMADKRFATRMRRVLLSTLLGLEGAGTGASVGAQFSGGNMSFIGGGMGIGALVGLGYASFQRGTEANLEPGDTFVITVGDTRYRPVSREWQTILYPAAGPAHGKARKR